LAGIRDENDPLEVEINRMIEIHDQIMVYKINNEAQNDEFKKEVGHKLESNSPPVINIFGGIKKKLAETKVK